MKINKYKILELAAIPAIVIMAAISVLHSGCEDRDDAVPWSSCNTSSNWDGPNAEKRMMNILSPSFSAEKVREYISWQKRRGCDHVHVILVNEHNGEGAGYDALLNEEHKNIALNRIHGLRMRGLGVVGWIVADDSNGFRKKIFSNPDAYAKSLVDFMPYFSYIVLGIEMNEGVGSMADWSRLCTAIRNAGWSGPIATHHSPNVYSYARLGSIIMDQQDPSCSEATVEASVARLVKQGFNVCGFEYARNPSRSKAEAAFRAGAFAVGNY